MPIISVTSNDEFHKYIEQDKLTFIYFTAEWCEPCQAIAPKFEQLSDSRVKCNFLKVDIDELVDVAIFCNIEELPTFQAFKNGKDLSKENCLIGADEAKLEKFIANYN